MASTGYGARPRSFLPRDPRVEEPYRLTPQLAFRIGILGALALAAFALLILRLWALQVLSGDEYLRIANNNQLRKIRVEAQRGLILDRNGRPLVTNRTVTSIQIWPADLPRKHRYRELRRLARVAGVPFADVLRRLDRQKDDPIRPVTVKTNASEALVAFISERQAEFPGVHIANTQVRRYPFGALAAQTLGHVGEVTEQQLEQHPRYHLGDHIGQRGVEAAFDRFLRGRAGIKRLFVDSSGRPTTGILPAAPAPTPGDSVRTTLDIRLQKVAEDAVRYGIGLAIENENWYANGGAAVALDPRNGDVLALASLPTYHPGVYVNPRRHRGLRFLLDEAAAEEANFPNTNRAIAGQYPPGSTFKPVTALAAMQEGFLSPYTPIECPPVYYVKGSDGRVIAGGVFRNWNPNSGGWLTLPQAIEQSCDTYFYALGNQFYGLPRERGHPLQQWAARWGFGRPTGLDTGGEASGLLPTPEWRLRTYTPKTDPGHWQVDRLWKPGDSIQLAIGQKDLLVTPLQMANFYAMIANGGRLVRPHLLMDVEQPGGRRKHPLVLRRYGAPPPREAVLNPGALTAVQAGLYLATHGASGTATAVFGDFPVPIAGKTGTAEKAMPNVGLVDQSWFCGYGPVDSPRLTVCVVIENGGFGGEAAAPAALKIFQAFFHARGGNLAAVRTD